MAAWLTRHKTCWVGSSYSITSLLSLWALRRVTVKIKYFWFVTWPLSQGVTWLCGWDPLTLSDHPAKFGVHRPYGTGNNDVCNISSNSNSIPMPRFQCRSFQMAVVNKFLLLFDLTMLKTYKNFPRKYLHTFAFCTLT